MLTPLFPLAYFQDGCVPQRPVAARSQFGFAPPKLWYVSVCLSNRVIDCLVKRARRERKGQRKNETRKYRLVIVRYLGPLFWRNTALTIFRALLFLVFLLLFFVLDSSENASHSEVSMSRKHLLYPIVCTIVLKRWVVGSALFNGHKDDRSRLVSEGAELAAPGLTLEKYQCP